MSELQPEPEVAPVEYKDSIARVAAKIGACIGTAAIVSLPVAAVSALDNAEVHRQIGPHPATIEFTANGSSSLRTGLADNLFIDKSWHGIGLSARIDGSGTADIGSSPITAIISQNRLNAYVGLGHDSQSVIEGFRKPLIDDAVDKFTRYELIGTGALGALGGALLYTPLGRMRRLDGSRNPYRRTGWSLATAAVVGASVLTTNGAVQSFENTSPHADARYPIASLKNTGLAGAYADSSLLKQLVDRSVPNAKKYFERGKDKGRQYVVETTNQLQSQRALMAAPREDEVALLLESDRHSNEPMIRATANFIDIYKADHGDDAIEQILDAGDRDYGTPFEKYYRSLFKLLSSRVPVVGVRGNHDLAQSTEDIENAGVTLVDGDVVKTGSTTVLGEADPSQTVLFGATTLPEGVTQTTIGDKAYETAKEQQPEVTLLHEGYAVAAMLGVDDIKKVMATPSSYQTPYMDGIRDIPTNMIAYGHWHEDAPYKVLDNSDGTWTVVFQLGTAGGAIGDATIGNMIGLPYEPPKKQASFVMAFKNKTSGLITGAQIYRFDPDGTVTIEPRIDFGTSDGQPYEVDSAYAATVSPTGEPLTSDAATAGGQIVVPKQQSGNSAQRAPRLNNRQ
jgi:hypothetical protein